MSYILGMELSSSKLKKPPIYFPKKTFLGNFREWNFVASRLKKQNISYISPIKVFLKYRDDCWSSRKIKSSSYSKMAAD